jgi:PRC-barrel domain
MSDATYQAGVASQPVETDETSSLISSQKVDGTRCYNRNGDHLGTVDHMMIDKYSGQVSYVVMSFGGFLGIGQSYHPLPWRSLTYDTKMGGYVLDADRARLEAAPRYMSSNAPNWNDPGYRSQIDDYWVGP